MIGVGPHEMSAAAWIAALALPLSFALAACIAVWLALRLSRRGER